MKRTRSPRNRGILIFAVVLILAGTVVLLGNTGIVPASVSRVLVSWQMLLIVIGLVQACRKHYASAVLLAAVGALFMIPFFTYVENWRGLYGPFLIIIAGLSLLIHSFGAGKRRRLNTSSRHGRNFRSCARADGRSGSDDGYVVSEVAFGAVRHLFLEPVFKGGRIRNSFGSTYLDLRKSTLAEGDTFIDVECSFGGIELRVGEDWIVVDEVETSIAGVNDERRVRQSAEAGTVRSRLVLRGRIIAGGIEIKD